MPDITMCNGEGCPVKESCYRFMAIANEYRQSYFLSSPIKDGKCDRQIYILEVVNNFTAPRTVEKEK